jgi:NADH-quinone oxidoreductase subunit E
MSYKFNKDLEDYFQWLLTRYPKKDAVLLPLLHRVQGELGFLTSDAIDYVASRLDLSSARVKEVSSFYSMFKFEKHGKFRLQVCHNLSCYLKGSDEVIQKVKDLLKIKEGETTSDGLFSLERVECLAACSTGPAMQVNVWDYFEDLDTTKVEKVIELLRNSKAACPAYSERMAQGGVA